MKTLALCLIAIGLACGPSQPVLAPTPSASARRADILARDIAWLGDSVPLVRFNIPHIYGLWRLQVEQCTGLSRPGWPLFYVAPIVPLSSDGRVAMYASGSNSIVFALAHEGMDWIVRHELLHFLLAPLIPKAPKGETPAEAALRVHPPYYFDGRCAFLVQPQG